MDQCIVTEPKGGEETIQQWVMTESAQGVGPTDVYHEGQPLFPCGCVTYACVEVTG